MRWETSAIGSPPVRARVFGWPRLWRPAHCFREESRSLGAEAGEDKQFEFGSSATLDLDGYLADSDRGRIRAWWRVHGDLRRTRPAIKGPAPIDVRFADGQLLAISRGQRGDYFVVLNFGGGPDFTTLAISICLTELTASSGTRPGRRLRFLAKTRASTPMAARRSGAHHALHVPDYGAVILERVD